jgi:hypothetical protein
VYVNIADPTHLSVVDSGYVEEKIIVFIFSTGRKTFLLLIFLCSFCLDQGSNTKITGIAIYIMLITPKNSRQSIQYRVCRQAKELPTAKYFRRSILKGSRQMLWYLNSYLMQT